MHLSPRELSVLKKLAEGLTVKEVAAKLYVAPSTIVTHKKNIYTKTQTRTLVQLGAIAVRKGIIAVLLFFALSVLQPESANSQVVPDLTEDIAPSHGFATIADTEASFNNARRQEEIQLGLTPNVLGDIDLPSQEVWDNYSDDQKVIFLINEERRARDQVDFGGGSFKSSFFFINICYLAGAAKLLDDIAQAFSEELFEREELDHNGTDGKTPQQRVQDGYGSDAIFAGENLFAFATFTASDLFFLMELMVYALIFEDLVADSKHRQIIFTKCGFDEFSNFKQNDFEYIDDYKESGNEGYIGIGITYGPLFGFPHGAMIVMDFIDPVAGADIEVFQDSDLLIPDPCPDHLEVNGIIDMSNDGSFQTSGDFITDATIASDAIFDVTANAGHRFDNGFNIANGAVLTIQKGDCP